MKKYLVGVDVGFRASGLTIFDFSSGKLKIVDSLLIQTQKNSKKKNVRVSDEDVECIKKITSDIDSFFNKHNLKKSICLVGAEYPHGGAIVSRAARTMAMATAVFATYFQLNGITVECVSPGDVKMAISNSATATKKHQMLVVAKFLNAKVEKKYTKRSVNYKFTLKGKVYRKNFEHIADSVGAAIHVVKYSDLFKTYSRL